MKTVIFFVAVGMLTAGATASAAVINLTVTTDKETYEPGDSVCWSIYVSTSVGDNRGIALLAVDLHEDRSEMLEPALTETIGAFEQLKGSDFGFMQGFLLAAAGSVNPGLLADIDVYQLPNSRVLDVGNDGNEHLFATGCFTATVLGHHLLSITVNGANYWPNADDNAEAFEVGELGSAGFEVVPEPVSLSLLAAGGGLLVLRRRRA